MFILQTVLLVTLLEKTHLYDTDKWSSKWDGHCYLSGQWTNSLGVGILINKSCNCKVLQYQEIIVGRMQRIQLEIEDKVLNIFNIYAPNNGDISFFNILETVMSPSYGLCFR